MHVLRLAWSSYQTEHSLKKEKQSIEDAGFKYTRAEETGKFPESEKDVDVVIINSQTKVTTKQLKKWNRPGTIITASNGYEKIDLSACQEMGVQVVRTPQARATRVVEHTTALIYALIRDLPRGNQRLRSQHWTRNQSFYRVQRLSSLTVGILGFGVIGQKMATKIQELNPYRLIGHDPHKQGSIESSPGIEYASFDQFVKETQMMTVHIDGRKENKNMINKSIFKQMRDPGYLVNTARGSVVQLQDLREALDEGVLNGAGLDVFPQEPPGTWTEPLPESLIMTPHTAGFGPGMLSDLTNEIVQSLIDLSENREPKHTILSPRP